MRLARRILRGRLGMPERPLCGRCVLLGRVPGGLPCLQYPGKSRFVRGCSAGQRSQHRVRSVRRVQRVRRLRSGRRGDLYMFGWGPEEHAIRKRVSKPDLRDCVHVHGYADEATFVSYAKACDCFLIPSRIESIPVVFSDALQMKKPVIATEVGDMGLIMKQSPVGILIPPGDMEALYQAMCEMSESDLSEFVPHMENLSRTFGVKETALNWLKRLEAGEPLPGA